MLAVRMAPERPLQFGGVTALRAQADAAGGCALDQRHQEPPARRRVVAGQGLQFVVETLEAEAEAERLRVLEEERARLGEERACMRWLEPRHPRFRSLNWGWEGCGRMSSSSGGF